MRIRRVVTGNDARGESAIWRDSDHGNELSIPTAGVGMVDLWRTGLADAVVGEDVGERSVRLMPPPGGTLFRIVRFAPRSSLPNRPLTEAEWAAIPKDYADGSYSDDRARTIPGMHATPTTDYLVVLSGEIWAVMDHGEVHLKAGDVLVQRSTWHAWNNRGSEPCTLACVMVDGAA